MLKNIRQILHSFAVSHLPSLRAGGEDTCACNSTPNNNPRTIGKSPLLTAPYKTTKSNQVPTQSGELQTLIDSYKTRADAYRKLASRAELSAIKGMLESVAEVLESVAEDLEQLC